MLNIITLKFFNYLKIARDIANKYENYNLEELHLLYALFIDEDLLLRNILYQKLINPKLLENSILKEIKKIPKKPLPNELKKNPEEIKTLYDFHLGKNLLKNIKRTEKLYSILDFYKDMYNNKTIRSILKQNNVEKNDFVQYEDDVN